MKIIKHGLVTPKEDFPRAYNGWPTVISLSDGTLLAAWSGERLKHICPFGKVLAARSTDGGYTWDEPYIIQNTPLDDRDAGLCEIAPGRILMTSFSEGRDITYKYLEHWLHHPRTTEERELIEKRAAEITDADEARYLGPTLSLSTDNGYTWSNPTVVDVSSPHGPTMLRNGEILYVGSWAGKDTGYAAGQQRGIYALRLDKDANVIGAPQLIAPTAGGEDFVFCEPYAKQMPNGDILVAIRVESKKENVHSTYFCRSTDGGKTFSAAAPTGWIGMPAHMFVTSKGEVVITYGRREMPMGIRARVSRDNGYTWSEELPLREDGLDWDLGYPTTTENKNGELITVYYMKDKDSLNENRINYTIWTLN